METGLAKTDEREKQSAEKLKKPFISITDIVEDIILNSKGFH